MLSEAPPAFQSLCKAFQHFQRQPESCIWIYLPLGLDPISFSSLVSDVSIVSLWPLAIPGSSDQVPCKDIHSHDPVSLSGSVSKACIPCSYISTWLVLSCCFLWCVMVCPPTLHVLLKPHLHLHWLNPFLNLLDQPLTHLGHQSTSHSLSWTLIWLSYVSIIFLYLILSIFPVRNTGFWASPMLSQVEGGV